MRIAILSIFALAVVSSAAAARISHEGEGGGVARKIGGGVDRWSLREADDYREQEAEFR